MLQFHVSFQADCGIEGCIIMENCSRTVLTAVFVSIEVALLTEMKLYSSRRSVELAVKTLTRKLKGTWWSLWISKSLQWFLRGWVSQALCIEIFTFETTKAAALKCANKQLLSLKVNFNKKIFWIRNKTIKSDGLFKLPLKSSQFATLDYRNHVGRQSHNSSSSSNTVFRQNKRNLYSFCFATRGWNVFCLKWRNWKRRTSKIIPVWSTV